MTQQSMEERFDKKFMNGLCISCGEWFRKEKSSPPTACVHEINGGGIKQFISQEIERARQEVVSEVVEELEKLQNEKWLDAKHCTCLNYSTDQLKKKYNLE